MVDDSRWSVDDRSRIEEVKEDVRDRKGLRAVEPINVHCKSTTPEQKPAVTE